MVRSQYAANSADGTEIELHWYAQKDGLSGPAVVYLHGGGMIAGSAEIYDPLVRTYVEWTGVPFLSVDYRRAPEHRGETLAEDGFAGLTWLHDHAGDLAVDPSRIAIMGDSAGGGVAAAVAILARDQGVPVARQVLIYPMLDDRTAPDEHLTALPTTWSAEFNATGWRALLGEDVGTDRVSAIAAPARNSDFTSLAPAFIEVGELDIFRDEGVQYASRLWAAGVSAELHVSTGAPHGHDLMLIQSPLGERWKQDEIRVITAL